MCVPRRTNQTVGSDQHPVRSYHMLSESCRMSPKIGFRDDSQILSVRIAQKTIIIKLSYPAVWIRQISDHVPHMNWIGFPSVEFPLRFQKSYRILSTPCRIQRDFNTRDSQGEKPGGKILQESYVWSYLIW